MYQQGCPDSEEYDFLSSSDDNLSVRHNHLDHGYKAPDLIMPRLDLPCTRHFTDTGLQLGKIKLLVAGDQSVGKTSLIYALFNSCDHIVHCDPVQNHDVQPHTRKVCTEFYASTKPLPSYKTSNFMVDRNVCVVDTRGAPDTVRTQVIAYLETQFHNANMVLGNVETDAAVGVLTDSSSLDTFELVDVCLYLFDSEVKPSDLEYIARVSDFCAVIPLISKADCLSPVQIHELKVHILEIFKSRNLSPLLPGMALEDAVETLKAQDPGLPSDTIIVPCAVSSIPDKDQEKQEVLASVLMAPDYSPPLVTSQLQSLSDWIFSQHGTSLLRHTAAKKYADWRNSLLGTSISRNLDISSCAVASRDKACQSHSRKHAHLQTAHWAARLEAISRTENVRFRTGLQSHRSKWKGRNSKFRIRMSNEAIPSSFPRRKAARRLYYHNALLSSSIFNLDPLCLVEFFKKAASFSLHALGVLVGINVLALFLSQGAHNARGISRESNRLTGLTFLSLKFLGGGWAKLKG